MKLSPFLHLNSPEQVHDFPEIGLWRGWHLREHGDASGASVTAAPLLVLRIVVVASGNTAGSRVK